MFDNAQKVWHNGKLIPFNEANISIASHCIHYASAVFEGIRGYRTPQGLGIFRLADHLQRLADSANIYRMPVPFSTEELRSGVFELLKHNVHEHPYIRPIVLRGYGALGVNPLKSPVEAFILSWNWGAYLGHAALEEGVEVMVSSWRRPAPDTLPTLAKSAANYANSQLIKLEAIEQGYHEGIALDYQGNVAEGSGENIFVVRKGVLYTPPLSSSVLPGITRDTVIQLAADLEIPCREEIIPREMLHIADEVFFCGTAAEISPIRSISKRIVGGGKPGPVTKLIQKEFKNMLSGETYDRHGWLDYGREILEKAATETVFV